MTDELNEEIDEVNPGSFLARLWRTILFKDGYIRYIIPRTNGYISRICIQSDLSNSKISINKTNIQNKIISTDMTWKNLIFLLKDIIVVSDILVTFKIKRKGEIKEYTEKGLSNELLSKVWIKIKKDFKTSLPELIEDYLSRTKGKVGAISETNLNKKIEATTAVSWKTLVFLIDEILYSESIILCIKVEHKGNSFTEHKMEYYIGNKEE